MNLERKEVVVKLVYAGTPGSGARTNIFALMEMLDSSLTSSLRNWPRNTDYPAFNLSPPHFPVASGLSLRFRVYTLPGNPTLRSVRKAILAGVDGLAYIADSRWLKDAVNLAAFRQLKDDLRENGIKPSDLPMVVQFNKRDLENIVPQDEIRLFWGNDRLPTFGAMANRGEGVLDTFEALLRYAFDCLDHRYNFASKFGFDLEETIASVLPATACRAGTSSQLTEGEIGWIDGRAE